MIFQAIGFLILLAFYGCYFAKMLALKGQGIQTDRLGKDKTGIVRGVEMTVKAATLLAAAAQIISMLFKTTRFPAWLRLTGAGIGSAGVLLFILAVLTMRENWRAGVPPQGENGAGDRRGLPYQPQSRIFGIRFDVYGRSIDVF